jgi:hypothetical protein
MKKVKSITQIGIVVSGTCVIHMWGGGKGVMNMHETFIPYEKISKDNILRCVNDGGFGCESIESARIDISIKYDNRSEEYNRTIEANSPHHTKHFLGWKELREQGINC